LIYAGSGGSVHTRMRKIYLIPNIVTTLNMASGFYSIVAAIHLDFVTAAWAIIVAGVFDMMDGRIARMAKATSEFGVQYDSLSDLVSFGLAPAILMYQWSLEPFGRLGWMGAFLYAACGALRLARFNVTCSKLPKGYFQGLASPIAAGAVATLVIFTSTLGWIATKQIGVLILAFTLAGLMISTIPFPSFKELNWRSRASFGYLAVGVLVMILIAVHPEITLFLMILTYLVASLLWNLGMALGLFRRVLPAAKETTLV
jgi:CDP-diacylglycerol--serine O-phosphatidyltransferase